MTSDARARRLTVIGGLVGLVPAAAIGSLALVLSDAHPLLGSGALALVYMAPYAVTLAVSRAPDPSARGGLLLALGLLSLVASFSTFSLVTVVLLPATFVILLAGAASLSGHGARSAAPYFLAGLVGAAIIGFSFYSLFGLEADEPRCWYGVQESGCVSDVISNREAALGLLILTVGAAPFLVASRRRNLTGP